MSKKQFINYSRICFLIFLFSSFSYARFFAWGNYEITFDYTPAHDTVVASKDTIYVVTVSDKREQVLKLEESASWFGWVHDNFGIPNDIVLKKDQSICDAVQSILIADLQNAGFTVLPKKSSTKNGPVVELVINELKIETAPPITWKNGCKVNPNYNFTINILDGDLNGYKTENVIDTLDTLVKVRSLGKLPKVIGPLAFARIHEIIIQNIIHKPEIIDVLKKSITAKPEN